MSSSARTVTFGTDVDDCPAQPILPPIMLFKAFVIEAFEERATIPPNAEGSMILISGCVVSMTIIRSGNSISTITTNIFHARSFLSGCFYFSS